ncbi:DNA-binding protein [Acinetobacter junii]|uniref:DNA-binding protein n=1 Tax=Acinetobacter junii TaxID=40215 RepID=UPI002B4BBC2B|nr:DNA-binding protein [Acinetobacter junii]WRL36393.1 DNA-binding protein [Acinetobacter junii]
MPRLTVLDRMTLNEKLAESKRFWESESEALFPPKTVAIVLDMSLSWLQNKRCSGDGIPFCKPSGNKIIYYKKSDVVEYINRNKLAHTA